MASKAKARVNAAWQAAGEPAYGANPKPAPAIAPSAIPADHRKRVKDND